METNTTQETKFVPAVCPKCGGQLQVDPTQEAAVCQYCGTPFIVDKAINQYNIQNATIEHADNVTINQKGAAESFFDFAGEQMNRSREEHRIDKQIQAEQQKEFLKNGWKIMAVLFVALIIMFLLANVLHLWG